MAEAPRQRESSFDSQQPSETGGHTPDQIPAMHPPSMNTTPRVSVQDIKNHREQFKFLKEATSWGRFFTSWKQFGFFKALDLSSQAQGALTAFCKELGCANAKTVEKLLDYSQASPHYTLNLVRPTLHEAFRFWHEFWNDNTKMEKVPTDANDKAAMNQAANDLKVKYEAMHKLMQQVHNQPGFNPDSFEDKPIIIADMKKALHELRIALDNYKQVTGNIKDWKWTKPQTETGRPQVDLYLNK